MNAFETLNGICLSTMDYQERARIATYFTREQGRVDVILPQARGPKAKHSGASTLGGVFQLHLKLARSGGQLHRLEQYETLHLLEPPNALSYECYQCMMPCLELLKKLALAFSEDAARSNRLMQQYEAMLHLWKAAETEAQLLWPMLWFWQGLLGLSGAFPSWRVDVITQSAIPPQLDAPRLYYLPSADGVTLDAGETYDDQQRWPLSPGLWRTLGLLESAQPLPLSRFLELPEPPLQTLEKARAFYLAVLAQHQIVLNSVVS